MPRRRYYECRDGNQRCKVHIAVLMTADELEQFRKLKREFAGGNDLSQNEFGSIVFKHGIDDLSTTYDELEDDDNE